jgi:hypothetical protein
MALVGFKAPALPLPPPQYDVRQQNDLLRTLRLYFNRLDSLSPNESQSYRADAFIGGTFKGSQIVGTSLSAFGSGLVVPYGAFQDSTDQIAANTTTAYPVTYNTTDYSNGVFVENSSRITPYVSGLYNLQFSIQLVNTDAQIHDIDIWFRKNGTNIANSNSRYSVPNSHGGVDGHLIAALNLFTELNARDYVEIMWKTDNVAVSIQALPTSSSPSRPAIPSVIATLSWVSAIPNRFVLNPTKSLTLTGYAPTVTIA